MKIELIPSNPDLAEYLYQHRQDPVTVKFNPLMPASVDSLRDRLSKSGSDLSRFLEVDAFLWFARAGDQIVGHVTMQNINRMMLTAEIGYGVDTPARGKGVATAAVRELSKNVFAQTPLRKLIAYVHEENWASRKVLEKIGFRNEGLLREHFLIQGQPVNEIIYGLLKSDFQP